MAEAVGVVASVATLSKVIQYSTTIIKRIRSVPKEISDLSEEVSQLSTDLDILHELQNIALIPENAAAKQIWTVQQASIAKAQTRILAVHRSLTTMEVKSAGLKGKLTWLVISKEETSSLLQNLLQVRMALTSAMSMTSRSLLQLALHAEEMRAIRDLGVSSNNNIPEDKTAIFPDHSAQTGIGTAERHISMSTNNIFLDCSSFQFSLDLPILGRMTSTLTTLKHHTGINTYAISLLLQFPFSRVFIADIFLRSWSFSWLNFRILRDSTLAVVKLVPEDSPFLNACRRGDVDVMKQMLQSHQASPNEITLDHRTPMWSAIESGKTQAVELLLHYGSDINEILGLRQTSPLVIAIRKRNVDMVRLLLAHGACEQHVSALGWTPLFYLWSVSSSKLLEQPAESVLSVLANRSDFNMSHSGILDTRGYGAIHMAAIRGTATDIHALVRCGVDPALETGLVKWQAMHYAVLEGRLDTFEALLTHCGSDQIHVTDAQGWTLLHISAIAGHGDISRRLLELGVDRHALTSAQVLCMPDGVEHLETEVRGRQWTASQLAALHSTHRHNIFLQAVSTVMEGIASHAARVVDMEYDSDDWADAHMFLN